MPDWKPEILRRLAPLKLAPTREAEIADELSQHLEDRYQELVTSGQSEDTAFRTALNELKGEDLLARSLRPVERNPYREPIVPGKNTGNFFSGVLQDIRYALRVLRKSPGFTAVAILTLAFGIGANTALFSAVNGVLLDPLPYPQPQQLMALYSSTTDSSRGSISYPNFLDWQRDNRTFAQLAAYRGDTFNLTGAGEPEQLKTEMVSADFFPILGVKPVLGRLFTSQDDHADAAPVVLLSEGLWRAKFGGSPEILGQSISLSGTPYTVIGVIPANFYYSGDNFGLSEIYVPLGQWTDSTFLDRRVSMGLNAVGRLKADVSLAQARADMDGISQTLAKTYPDADKGVGITVISLKVSMVGDVAGFLYLLLGAVGFVLLIACVNIANLFLARSAGRAREFAIRAALGASRGRVIRQLLTESVLLSLTGGICGLLVAAWGTRAAIRILPQALPRARNIHLDAHVLLFTLGVSIFVGILFGLAPALKNSSANLQETLKEGGRGSSGVHHRVQRFFVIVEMALALVLLVGAGLMIRTLVDLWRVNPGFNPHNLVSFNIAFPAEMMKASAEEVRNELVQLNAALRSIPGVESVSVAGGALPMQGSSELPFWRANEPAPKSQAEMNWALLYLVQPDYLKVMGTPLLRGRFVTAQDTHQSVPVIVIDEDLAKKFFPGQNPIGQRINLAVLGVQAEIVGVAGHVKHWGLDDEGKAPVEAELYFPIVQIPDKFLPLMSKSASFVIRTRVSPYTLLPAIRKAIEQVNSQQVVSGVETLQETIDKSLAERRFSMILLGVFAAVALILACVGIYGVISYLVGQRVHEIGIRMALGAQRRDILRLVLGQGAIMALLGVAIGIAAALGLTRLMASQIFMVSAHDPLTFAGVCSLLILVALAACYIPARRAMRVDPMVALRYE
jgi:predicted permease